jgi:glyoxylase I family protein
MAAFVRRGAAHPLHRRWWKTRAVPFIMGRVEVNLTVREPARSAAWYAELLGMTKRYDYLSDDGRLHCISLVEPRSGLMLCLVGHAANTGEPFSELRTGLDHLEFLVATRSELDAWADRPDQLGIAHSGVKELPHTPNSMVTFRDPDNIQLEFFWRSPPNLDQQAWLER